MIDRLTLHAYQLTIPVGPPDAEELKTFVAPPDKKFTAVVKLLHKHTRNTAVGFSDEDDFHRILNAEPLVYPISLNDNALIKESQK